MAAQGPGEHDDVGLQPITVLEDGGQETLCRLCRTPLLFYPGDVASWAYVRANDAYYLFCTMCQSQLMHGCASTDVPWTEVE